MTVVERFIRYVKINTQSEEGTARFPSTDVQWDLARLLVEECKNLGLTQVFVSEHGIVTATLPSNTEGAPTMGWIAHMDTSPDLSGNHVQPRFVENYDGGSIQLNENYELNPADFPELKNYLGQTIITTDGNTLLGADDKAGIAEILTALEILIQNPDLPHGTIRLAFTPDEEVGHGTSNFDITAFGADFAYTIDGGALGSIEFENFNAAAGIVTIQGRNVHPGGAKHKMINANHLAMEFDALLPHFDRPEYTDDYEGFFHLMKTDASVEEAKLVYIIRDHDASTFEWRKNFFIKCANQLNQKYNQELVSVHVKDSYQNMREMIMPHYHVVQTALDAMETIGVTPRVDPIRGGTDGARLSYLGLPCPNLFTGGHNYHGRYEFIPVESMEKAVAVLVEIAKRTSK
jgi:tripeptide aminopeptidase